MKYQLFAIKYIAKFDSLLVGCFANVFNALGNCPDGFAVISAGLQPALCRGSAQAVLSG